MAFYRKKANFHTIEKTAEPLLLFLRNYCQVLKEEDGTTPLYDVREAFYADKEAMDKISSLYKNIFSMMRLGDFLEVAPLNNNWTEVMIYITKDKETFIPTVSPTHVRLPKLSHLITLTPDDFFSVFKLIAAGKKTAVGSSLILPGDMSMPPTISQFFITNDKTWRTNPEYSDRKWTLKTDIQFIAALEPTRDNQLCAMQYLTVRQNDDLFYFPLESAIALELDECDQLNEDYVVLNMES